MSDNPKLGQGNVSLVLGNESFILRPTINAVQVLCQRHGSLTQTLEKVGNFDFNTCVDVVAVGLGPSFATAKARQSLAEKIFAAGLTHDTGNVADKCAAYIMSLLRGGRPAPEEQAPADDLQVAGPAAGN